jgi:hypothetical protein
MYLSFESLQEFRTMAEALGYVQRDSVALNVNLGSALVQQLETEARRIATEQACEQHEAMVDLVPVSAIESAPARTVAEYGPQHGTEPDAPKRKRRTKAEMEAARAEPKAAPATNPLDNLKPEAPVVEAADTDDVKAAIADMAGLYDGSDALAQLDEGRKFIAAHGFPAYNETMHVVGVPSNIAAHTPEQRSLHRAAMAFMAARKG